MKNEADREDATLQEVLGSARRAVQETYAQPVTEDQARAAMERFIAGLPEGTTIVFKRIDLYNGTFSVEYEIPNPPTPKKIELGDVSKDLFFRDTGEG